MGASHSNFTFSTLWCFVLGLVAKVASTTEWFGSSLAAETLLVPLGTGAALAMPPVTSLVRTRLMVSVTASKLGECRNTNSASRPVVLVVLPNCIVILPLSSHNRRSCAGASHGIFYFALHTYLENEFLGSQGTYLASRETLIASVEAERSWDEVRLVACPMKADFCSTTTEVLAIETFLCFRV